MKLNKMIVKRSYCDSDRNGNGIKMQLGGKLSIPYSSSHVSSSFILFGIEG